MGRSLRYRLFAGAVVWIVVALILAGIFISGNFAASIERERLSDLEVSLRRVLAQIRPDENPPVAPGDTLDDPRYAVPLSGTYWQIDDLTSGASYRSRSLWDSTLDLSPSDKDGALWRPLGPDGVPLIALAREVDVEGVAGSRTFRIVIAKARDNPDQPLHRFSFDLFTALGVLAIVLSAAAWLQISLGLRPLAKATRNVERVRRGELTRLPLDGPDELRPLVNEVNTVLDANDASLTHARQRASDLAHGLKTPLAVVAATAERIRESNRQDAQILDIVVGEMNARTEYQLRLARLRIRTPTHGVRTSLNEALLRSVAVLRKTERGERLNWVVELDEALEVDLDEHDLLELTGVVLENACKWAQGKIGLECRAVDGVARLTVEDDGMGVSDSDIAKLGQRGERLDQSVPGYGLGLAIVFDAVRLNSGTIELGRSSMGGLQVDIRLPLAASIQMSS